MRPQTSRDPKWGLAGLALAALLLSVSPLWTQGQSAEEQDAALGSEGEAGDVRVDEGQDLDQELLAPQPGEDATLMDIDSILRGDEAVLEGGGYTYDPGERRDPFRSLLAARQNDDPQGPRPEGIPGLLIDEINITGIFRTASGWVAQVQASNLNKSHLIKVNDQLYDGDVLSISKNEVVFKQIVRDPTALKPFREVTKKLNP